MLRILHESTDPVRPDWPTQRISWQVIHAVRSRSRARSQGEAEAGDGLSPVSTKHGSTVPPRQTFISVSYVRPTQGTVRSGRIRPGGIGECESESQGRGPVLSAQICAILHKSARIREVSRVLAFCTNLNTNTQFFAYFCSVQAYRASSGLVQSEQMFRSVHSGTVRVLRIFGMGSTRHMSAGIARGELHRESWRGESSTRPGDESFPPSERILEKACTPMGFLDAALCRRVEHLESNSARVP